MRILLFAVAAFALASDATAGTVFRCAEQGRVTYSDRPCPSGVVTRADVARSGPAGPSPAPAIARVSVAAAAEAPPVEAGHARRTGSSVPAPLAPPPTDVSACDPGPADGVTLIRPAHRVRGADRST